jgi:YD repeat-containing protein
MRKAWLSFTKLAALAGGLVLALSVSSAHAITQGSSNTYKYDALGRLIEVIINNGGSNVTTITYTYDAAGNRTQTVTGSTTNNGPTAVADAITTAVNIPITWDPRLNDTDSQGDYLTITANSSPVHGTVVNNGNSLTYTPNSGYTGTDTFTYTISDGHLTSTATETMTVTADPAANPDTAVTTPNVTGQPLTSVSLDPRVNDSFPSGLSLTVTGVTDGAYGSASVNSAGTLVTYTPGYGYVGTDSFTYTVSDGVGGTAMGTVNVTIANPPVATNDSVQATQQVAYTFDPRANDSDPGGYTPLSVNGIGPQPANGTVTYTGTSLTYTSNATFVGKDTFTYTVKDSVGLVSQPATVTVTVIAGNAPPTAVNDSMDAQAYYTGGAGVQPSATIDPRTNDISPEGYTLSITGVTQGAKGTVTTNGTTVTYLYNTAERRSWHDTDSFTYTISDGHNPGTSTATVTVSIEVDTTQ